MTEALGDLTNRTCNRCGERPVGPGGILCPPCVDEINAANDALLGDPPTTEPPPSST